MPILRGSVTFARFRAELEQEAPRDTRKWLARALSARGFEPIDRKSDEERAAGFVELEDRDAVEFASILQGEYALFAWRVDTLKVPAAALKAEVEKWAKVFELDKGRPPGRAEKNAYRDQVRHEMRARAIPSTKTFDVSWNLESNAIQIWATSRKILDEVQATLEGAFEMKLRGLTPSALAEHQGIDGKGLGPTPELAGTEVTMEVADGQA